VLRQLELARELATAPSRNLPVVFTPDGMVSAFVPALMAAFNGKTVLEGASPIGKRLGEKVFDAKLCLYDPMMFAPHSRPCDDEAFQPADAAHRKRRGTFSLRSANGWAGQNQAPAVETGDEAG
jgi:predicted Zn-dependent protease